MVQAIVVAVEDDEDAIDWIIYHIELKESIEILIACNRLSGIDKKVYVQFSKSFVFSFHFPFFFVSFRCIISELRTTIKTILDLWKFFAEVTLMPIQIELFAHEFNRICQYKYNYDEI